MESSMPKFLTLFLVTLVSFGLLASLFMGHGFDGIKFFDILLMLGLAAAVFFVIRALRRPAQPQPLGNVQYAGHGNNVPQYEPTLGGGAPVTAAVTQARPAWFDEQNFLRTAKS